MSYAYFTRLHEKVNDPVFIHRIKDLLFPV